MKQEKEKEKPEVVNGEETLSANRNQHDAWMFHLIFVGKQEKDTNKPQEEAKPADEGEGDKGGYFKRVSIQALLVQHETYLTFINR